MNPAAISSLPLFVIDVLHVRDQVHAALREQAAPVEHGGQHPDCMGAPAVPEQEHPVAGFVAVHEIPVGLRDVVIDPVAGDSHAGHGLGQPVQPPDREVSGVASSPHARVVVGDLIRAVLAQPFKEAHDVGVLVGSIVFPPGAVAA